MTACLHQEAGLPPLQVATAKVHTDRSSQCYVRLQKVLPCLIALFIGTIPACFVSSYLV